MTSSDGLPQVLFSHRFLSAHPVAFHEHPCLELVLVTRGSCRIHVGKTALTGRRGDVFLLPARIPHDQVGAGVVGTFYIGFLPGAHGLDNVQQVIPTAGDRYVMPWIKTIVELNRDTELPPPMLGNLLAALLSRLKYIQRKLTEPPAAHPRTEAALAYVQQRIGQPLSIQSLSQAVGVSPSHLRTLFRRHVGLSPRQYQQSLRMSLAHQRLLDPYPSIKEVAVECGYRDVNLFIRLFRKRYGQSPGRWRQSQFTRMTGNGI